MAVIFNVPDGGDSVAYTNIKGTKEEGYKLVTVFNSGKRIATTIDETDSLSAIDFKASEVLDLIEQVSSESFKESFNNMINTYKDSFVKELEEHSNFNSVRNYETLKKIKNFLEFVLYKVQNATVLEEETNENTEDEEEMKEE